MNRVAVLLLGLALLGDAPLPSALVAGTVRDQHGEAIAAARISLYNGGHDVADVVSGRDGTFAANGARADYIRVQCDFCRPMNVSVPDDGIVVAIVQRYDAVRNQSPSSEDLEHLPYANVESALSLSPFVVLNETTTLFPGPRLSDRRISSYGGLFVLNGIPDYDPEANVSPYYTVPTHHYTTTDVLPSSEAYLYGDTASAGTFIAATTGGSSFGQAGSGGAARGATSASNVLTGTAYSNDIGGDVRGRADATASFPISGAVLGASVGSGQANFLPAASPDFSTNFSAAQLTLQRTSGLDLTTALTADRGTYYYDSPTVPEAEEWSDVDAHAIVRSHAAVAPFALLDFRRSTASSTLGQSRGEIGVDYDDSHFQVLAATGVDDASYGAFEYSPGGLLTAHDAVTSATWSPNSMLSLEASWSRGYYLPTFAQAYAGSNASLYVSTNNSIESTLMLSDAKRVRVGLTALRFTDDLGNTSGSAGVSVAWQISPDISLRTWVLRVSDARRGAAAVGSTWLTYDLGKFRIDAIWRRDILNTSPDAHVDGAISGPITRQLMWYISSEQRNGVRSLDAGLRW